MSAGGPAAYTPAFTNLDPRRRRASCRRARGRRHRRASSPTAAPRSVPSRRSTRRASPPAQSGRRAGRPRRLVAVRRERLSADRHRDAGEVPARAWRASSTRTIESIAGICRATVNLALPQRHRLHRTTRAAHRLRARRHWRGIAARRDRPRHRRASSPPASPASPPQNVTITNEQGQLLSTTDAGDRRRRRRPPLDRGRLEPQHGRQGPGRRSTRMLGAGKATGDRHRRAELRQDARRRSQTFGDVQGRPADARPRPRSCGRPADARRRRGRHRREHAGRRPRRSRRRRAPTSTTPRRRRTAAIPTTQQTITVAPGDRRARCRVSLVVARDALNNVVDGAFDAKKQDAAGRRARSRRGLRQLGNVVKQTVGWRADRDGADSYTSVCGEVRRPQGVAREGRRRSSPAARPAPRSAGPLGHGRAAMRSRPWPAIGAPALPLPGAPLAEEAPGAARRAPTPRGCPRSRRRRSRSRSCCPARPARARPSSHAVHKKRLQGQVEEIATAAPAGGRDGSCAAGSPTESLMAEP